MSKTKGGSISLLLTRDDDVADTEIDINRCPCVLDFATREAPGLVI